MSILDPWCPKNCFPLEEQDVIRAGDIYTPDRGKTWKLINNPGWKYNSVRHFQIYRRMKLTKDV